LTSPTIRQSASRSTTHAARPALRQSQRPAGNRRRARIHQLYGELGLFPGCRNRLRLWRCNTEGPTRSTISLAPLRGTQPRIAAFLTDASGYLYAIDADSGALIWRTKIDEQRSHQFTGSVAVYQLGLVWTRSLDKRPCRWDNVYCNPGISMAVTVIPGALFAGAMDGRLSAYSADDGKLLWSFDASDSFTTTTGAKAEGGALDAAGPVIAGGMLYVHSGYWGRTGPGSVLLAFSVDGR
jgi:outer membrane protein assembly factor BamB